MLLTGLREAGVLAHASTSNMEGEDSPHYLQEADSCCHGRTLGVDQARAIYGRSGGTRPAETRREDIGNTGVRGVGGGSRSLRPHGEH